MKNSQKDTILHLYIMFWLVVGLIGLIKSIGFLLSVAVVALILVFLNSFFKSKKVDSIGKKEVKTIYEEKTVFLKKFRSHSLKVHLFFIGLISLMIFFIIIIPVSIGWLRVVLVFTTLVIFFCWISND